jgi:hypothetical protein
LTPWQAGRVPDASDVDGLFVGGTVVTTDPGTHGTLVEHRGWTATVTDAAEPGNRWNRWMHPAVPADVPGVPCGYFVEAIKA